MASRAVNGWNIAAFALYTLLIPAAVVECIMATLAFAMSTDACHDDACDASYHVYPALYTVWIGVVVVLALTALPMFYGVIRDKVVIVWPFLGAAGLVGVFALGLAVLH